MKNYVLSIAGFDPSGGAGVLADVKTFESHSVTGMSVVTALTFQNDAEFEAVKWMKQEEILQQYDVLNRRFKFSVIKIGLIENLEVLGAIVTHLRASAPHCLIVWDPILKASAGFTFHENMDRFRLFQILKSITLVTPNTDEAKLLTGKENEMQAAEELVKYCAVLLKGGHSAEQLGTDYLFVQDKMERLTPFGLEVSPKHGSGCVLSSAIAAQLAKGENMLNACLQAKKYTEQFLSSNSTLIGTHYA
ncbi:hydroxymethylpyrimidine/phosphomethylpyrimidine kinase [Marivirga lumbricoides]|uniref:hydroxymethylpyrimidine/phosphomethylpyrimidine kinase n=1 Tax=Marivirga lumbricoides TaxID=1046115 RepID=UPI001E299581